MLVPSIVSVGRALLTHGMTVEAPQMAQCWLQLADMRARDPAAKALIFTQFNSTLEWLMARLTQEGYGYRTISGSMPLKKRSQVILLSFGGPLSPGYPSLGSM